MKPPAEQSKKINRGKRAALSPNFRVPIDRGMLSALLKKHCARLQHPDDTDLLWFAAKLNSARLKFRAGRFANKSSYERYFEAQEAMATLDKVMQEIASPIRGDIEFLESSLATFDDQHNASTSSKALIVSMLRDNQGAIALVEKLHATLAEIQSCPRFIFPVLPPAKMDFQDQWHDVIGEVVAAYRAAMRPNNPNAPLSVHGEGPGGRFIADVMSYVAGVAGLKPGTVQQKIAERGRASISRQS